jgi:hypothetical protein
MNAELGLALPLLHRGTGENENKVVFPWKQYCQKQKGRTRNLLVHGAFCYGNNARLERKST